MLSRLPSVDHPDLLVGSATSDDAAVWKRPSGPALVATADFFTPIVDDPVVWGRIAAANAVSDVYAMGGRPLFGLNLVAWPSDQLPLDLLGQVLLGGAAAAAEGGWVVAGGHTVDGPEPMYGMAMTGEVDPDRILANRGGRPHQALVLTKPIGTGLLATAVKRSDPDAVLDGGWLHDTYDQGVAEMSRLNDIAAEVALSYGATAATDVTGFGLLGHLHELALASGLSAVIETGRVPRLRDLATLLDRGFIPGGTQRNLSHLEPHLIGGSLDDRIVLADAQTSGGLLFSCELSAAEEAAAALVERGHAASVIGSLRPAAPGTITIDP